MAAAVPLIAAYFTMFSFWSCLVWPFGRFSFFLKMAIASLLACTIADAGRSLERGPDRCEMHAMAALSVVFGIGLNYRRRLDIKRVLATILQKLTEQMRRYVIYMLDLLFICSSVSFYDPIELCPEEGFTKQRASVDVRYLM